MHTTTLLCTRRSETRNTRRATLDMKKHIKRGNTTDRKTVWTQTYQECMTHKTVYLHQSSTTHMCATNTQLISVSFMSWHCVNTWMCSSTLSHSTRNTFSVLFLRSRCLPWAQIWVARTAFKCPLSPTHPTPLPRCFVQHEKEIKINLKLPSDSSILFFGRCEHTHFLPKFNDRETHNRHQPCSSSPQN